MYVLCIQTQYIKQGNDLHGLWRSEGHKGQWIMRMAQVGRAASLVKSSCLKGACCAWCYLIGMYCWEDKASPLHIQIEIEWKQLSDMLLILEWGTRWMDLPYFRHVTACTVKQYYGDGCYCLHNTQRCLRSSNIKTGPCRWLENASSDDMNVYLKCLHLHKVLSHGNSAWETQIYRN